MTEVDCTFGQDEEESLEQLNILLAKNELSLKWLGSFCRRG